nr:hypothetical protein BaRGS_028679 [Batillaria attramentaria]
MMMELRMMLVAHTSRCHWYFNCTVAALENLGGHLSALEEECRYPQLFDTVTRRCREFINVRCGDRFEPVDPCEYDANQCRGANCVPCKHRYGSCRGRQNGIYPFHTERWTPTFITCYQQRNIAQDDCQPPTPIFSPVNRDCVALSDVPKTKGGLRPDCSFREDGFYPDEQGRCGIFFECQDGQFTGYDECPSGTVFDPLTLRCQQLDRSSPPCGEGQNPSCSDRHDGFHADPFGRCPYYFECRKNQFVRHLTCDFGAFDPVTEECVIPTELMPRPCGLLPNPYRQDGRYVALTRGCSFYFECKRGRFAGLKQCEFQDGGFFFNEKTGKCDFPQNICPPCGYRWWGW